MVRLSAKATRWATSETSTGIPDSAAIPRMSLPITVLAILRETTKPHRSEGLNSCASLTWRTVKSDDHAESPDGSIGIATKSEAIMQEREISSACGGPSITVWVKPEAISIASLAMFTRAIPITLNGAGEFSSRARTQLVADPCLSASISTTRHPPVARCAATFTDSVVLPTPPF